VCLMKTAIGADLGFSWRHIRLIVVGTLVFALLQGTASASLVWNEGLWGVDSLSHYVDAVSCPTSDLCVAVDEVGREITFDPAAPEQSVPVAIDAGADLTAVSCPSTTQCTAVSHGVGVQEEVTFDPFLPQAYTKAPVMFGSQISCPSVTQCTIVAGDVAEQTFNPQAPGPPQPVGLSNGGYWGGASACPSVDSCVDVEGDGTVVFFDPNSTAAATVIHTGADLTAIACPDATRCTAVGTSLVNLDLTSDSVASTSTAFGAREISCPAVDQCTALTEGGDEATFDPASPADASSTEIVSGIAPLAIACPSTLTCTVVAQAGEEISFDTPTPQTTTTVAIDAGSDYDALACSLPTMCLAGGDEGQIQTLGLPPLGEPGIYETISTLGQGITGVACPSTTQCVAVDSQGLAYTDLPTPSALPMIGAPVDSAGSPTALACPTVTSCTAVDSTGDAVNFAFSGPGGAIEYAETTAVDPKGALDAISCPTASQCTAVDQHGNEVTFPDGGSPVDIDGITPLRSISCPSTTLCVVVDADGEPLTFNPAAPADVTSPVLPVTGLAAVSCPTVGSCLAVTGSGRAVAFDPQTSAFQSAEPVTGGSGSQLVTVTCLSETDCFAMDSDGDIFVGTTAPLSSASTGSSATPAVTAPSTSPPSAAGPGDGAANATSSKTPVGLSTGTGSLGRDCVAPELRHKTLAQARHALRVAHCSTGTVRTAKSKFRKHTYRVFWQSVPAHGKHRAGYRVNLGLR
jgi:hypothetical protein